MQERFADRNAARNAHLPLGEYRKQLLVQAVERNIGSITIPKCVACMVPAYADLYIPRCLARECVYCNVYTVIKLCINVLNKFSS